MPYTFGVKDNGNVLDYSCIFYAMQHCFVAKVILMILLKFMQKKLLQRNDSISHKYLRPIKLLYNVCNWQ